MANKKKGPSTNIADSKAVVATAGTSERQEEPLAARVDAVAADVKELRNGMCRIEATLRTMSSGQRDEQTMTFERTQDVEKVARQTNYHFGHVMKLKKRIRNFFSDKENDAEEKADELDDNAMKGVNDAAENREESTAEK